MTSPALPPCRFCATPLRLTLCDLGPTPLANSYPAPGEEAAEARYPLHARVCPACWLVQVDDSVPPGAIFSDYAYFSSTSSSWVEHARLYADAMRRRLRLGPDSLVVEVASNDGYLLGHFAAAGVPVLGIEPAANVAAVAEARGVPTRVAFFGADLARRLLAMGRAADLMAANNVLAHVPDIRGFLEGFAILLKPGGLATFEFPHVLRLIEGVQFDTIYHEHFSYLSLVAVERVLEAVGLAAVDVEELPTHGGSLRLHVRHAGEPSGRLLALREAEHRAGLDREAGYAGFGNRVEAVRRGFLAYLAEARREGRRVAAYGAAAKGNTFLNVCGITTGDMAAVLDRSPAKQGRLTPGSHLPILPPEALAELAPDDLVILPWNLAGEVVAQIRATGWRGRFVTAVPEVRIIG